MNRSDKRASELRMVIELTDPPAAPELPAHVTVRAFQTRQDEEAVYDAHQEIFGDDLGVPRDRWADWLEEAFRPGFDPRFWILATVGHEVVGICLGHPCQTAEDAVVSILGVRRPWRRQGIASAMMAAAFVAFCRAGRRRVSLELDADNVSAIQLYERLGMRVFTRSRMFSVWPRHTRPGHCSGMTPDAGVPSSR